jgi:hypothetical protein
VLKSVGVGCSQSLKRSYNNRTVSRFMGYDTVYIFIQTLQDYPEDVNSKLLRNSGTPIPNYAELGTRRLESSSASV